MAYTIVYVILFVYLCTQIGFMRKFVLLIVALWACGLYAASVNDLLWDYTISAPSQNPDKGLSFAGSVNDEEGVRNGLKGIKLNSSGWCSFTKAAIEGTLKLTFGPRNGMNPASLQVFALSGEELREVEIVGTTCETRSSRTMIIPLTAEQNNIYITRLAETETVLQKIEFIAGEIIEPAPCEEEKSNIFLYSPDVRTDTMPANAAYFIEALREANQTGNKTIFLPNGVYDLGQMALTAIEANHISIIGESMEGTIIRNAPDYRYESINKSATLRIAPGVEGTYLQNLTIQNALDYYHDDNGRAVALWDQGTKTICKNVRLLSYQDTYFSDREGGLKYFEDCEIHGTVDFICGDGSVYFKNCLLYCERRSKDGSGTDAITASGAGKEDKGYVFDGCTIQSECPVVSLGRSWKRTPKCVFIHTILDHSRGSFVLSNKDIERWTKKGMTVLPELFGEYRSTDTEGRIISPETNIVEFRYKDKIKQMNTVLDEEKAGSFTVENILGEWTKEIIDQINMHNQSFNNFNHPKFSTQ